MIFHDHKPTCETVFFKQAAFCEEFCLPQGLAFSSPSYRGRLEWPWTLPKALRMCRRDCGAYDITMVVAISWGHIMHSIYVLLISRYIPKGSTSITIGICFKWILWYIMIHYGYFFALTSGTAPQVWTTYLGWLKHVPKGSLLGWYCGFTTSVKVIGSV